MEGHIRGVSRCAGALFAAALLVVTMASTGAAQTLDRVKLDQFFDRLAEKGKAMGSLTIMRDGQIAYTRAIGFARTGPNDPIPLTQASRFRIGSITKMFTAVMVLQLAEEGKLSLTDSLARFLPQIPNAGKITIAQMLKHRSGIPNVMPGVRDPGTPITKDQMLALIAAGTPLFAPDSRYSYSNASYFLLGLIIERVTGRSYGSVLEERISSRAGLNDTYVASGPIDVTRNESLTYLNTGAEWRQRSETHPSHLFGAGNIVSSPHDLARFADALFDLKLISRSSLDLMTTMRDGEGAGMTTFTFAGKTFYGHTGGADNYGAWLAYLPEERLAVAYATNAKVYPVEEIVKGALDIYYDRPFEIPSFETLVISPDILDRYVGEYASPGAPNRFTVSRDGSTLYVRPGSQTPAALEATGENRFQLLGGSVVFEFDARTGEMILTRTGASTIVFRKAN